MNKTLFKATFKSNWGVGLIIIAVMFMYFSIMVSMFDPDGIEGLVAMMESLPKEMVAAMGFDNLGTTLTTYLGSAYYNFIAIMFPMIFIIIVGNRLIAKHVDSGSMAYLLSTPNSRLKIVRTQALFFIASITTIFGFLIVAGIGISQAMFPGDLDIGGFILLNIVTLFLFYAISGISFFFSCIFDDTKHSLSFGAGIPVAFFVINLLANAGEQMSFLRYFTIFTLLNPGQILEGSSFTVVALLSLLAIAIATYLSGIVMFNRRNLPL